MSNELTPTLKYTLLMFAALTVFAAGCSSEQSSKDKAKAGQTQDIFRKQWTNQIQALSKEERKAQRMLWITKAKDCVENEIALPSDQFICVSTLGHKDFDFANASPEIRQSLAELTDSYFEKGGYPSEEIMPFLYQTKIAPLLNEKNKSKLISLLNSRRNLDLNHDLPATHKIISEISLQLGSN